MFYCCSQISPLSGVMHGIICLRIYDLVEKLGVSKITRFRNRNIVRVLMKRTLRGNQPRSAWATSFLKAAAKLNVTLTLVLVTSAAGWEFDRNCQAVIRRQTMNMFLYLLNSIWMGNFCFLVYIMALLLATYNG